MFFLHTEDFFMNLNDTFVHLMIGNERQNAQITALVASETLSSQS